jgi:hypothetical protein
MNEKWIDVVEGPNRAKIKQANMPDAAPILFVVRYPEKCAVCCIWLKTQSIEEVENNTILKVSGQIENIDDSEMEEDGPIMYMMYDPERGIGALGYEDPDKIPDKKMEIINRIQISGGK